MHVVMETFTRNPFEDFRRLFDGVPYACMCDGSGRGFHMRFGRDACDFCRLGDGEWRYFYRNLDEQVPRSMWVPLDNWVLGHAVKEDCFDSTSCSFYDSLLMESIENEDALNW